MNTRNVIPCFAVLTAALTAICLGQSVQSTKQRPETKRFLVALSPVADDMRAIPIMKSFGCKVVMDAGHAVQQPGGRGDASGGMRDMIPVIARCGVAAGADGLFIEVHENPDQGPSDGPNMLKLADLPALLREVVAIRKALTPSRGR